MQSIRVTTSVAAVLAVLLDDPAVDRYGLELINQTGYPSGTLYPILARLQKAGWVEANWEQIDTADAGRPARRYYRLTADGIPAARVELAELHRKLGDPARFSGRQIADGSAT
jgi:DNA-binding PadR family transcriptional regulator